MEDCTSGWTTDLSVCRPLQVLLSSIDVDEGTSAQLSPRLRLMLIVIGVVHCQTPNMLALASLWETALSQPSPQQTLVSSCNWGNIAGIRTHLDTSKCVCSQSGWCVKMCPFMFLVHLWHYFEVYCVSTPWATGQPQIVLHYTTIIRSLCRHMCSELSVMSLTTLSLLLTFFVIFAALIHHRRSCPLLRHFHS